MGSLWQDLAGTPFHVDYVDAGGVRTRYLEAGQDGQGAPIVLVHGTGSHLEVFLPVVPLLAHGRKVIAYDMVGHGLSAKPAEDYTTAVLSRHLLDLLESLGIESAVVVGHSLGALVAAWTAARHPERVARLVLVTPGTILDDPAVLNRIREGTLRALQQLDRDSIRQRLLWLFKRPEALTEEFVALRHRVYAQPGYKEAATRAMVMQDPAVRKRYAWREDWVKDIALSTLLIYSRDDPGTPLEGIAVLRKWLPQLKEAHLDGTGHFPTMEDPNAFAQAVVHFLESRGD